MRRCLNGYRCSYDLNEMGARLSMDCDLCRNPGLKSDWPFNRRTFNAIMILRTAEF
mgnify:CR=1 FL=1